MSPEVLDLAPETTDIDTSATDTDQIDAGGETPDGTADSTDEPGPIDPATPDATDGPAISEGKLSKSAKAHLAELGKTAPKLANSIRRSLFEADAIKREVPGGLKEITQLREQLDQYGAPEAIAKTREELNYFSKLDQQFTTGDPQFVQAMLDTPEGQQGFLKLAPVMLERFRELSPEAHDVYVAKQQMASPEATEFYLAGVRMTDLLESIPSDPQALEQWRQKAIQQFNGMAKFFTSISDRANKKVEAPKAAPQQQAPDERAQFNQEKEKFVRDQWNSEATTSAKSMIDAEINKLATARKFTDTQKAALLELGVGRLTKALKADPKFGSVAQRHFANKDKDAFLRHVTGMYRNQIPNVLRSAADAIQANKAAPKAGPVAVVPKPGAAPAATAKPDAGYRWVNARPDKSTIDFSKTNGLMIREHKAVLTNGNRIQWR